MALLLISLVLSFVAASLDRLMPGPGIRSALETLLSTGCLDDRFMAGETWRVATHMWIHGSFLHLTSNLVSLIALWALARRCYRGSEWFGIFLLSGIAAGPIQLLIQPAPGPDFSSWTSPVASIFGEPNSPLVGASGGICGLWGALSAVALQYWISSRRPIGKQQRGRALVWWLLIPFLVQMAVDARSPEVAGAGHIAGFVCGFLLAMAPRGFRPAFLDHRVSAQ